MPAQYRTKPDNSSGYTQSQQKGRNPHNHKDPGPYPG